MRRRFAPAQPSLLKAPACLGALLGVLLLAACNGEAPPEEAEKEKPAEATVEVTPEAPTAPALLLEPVDFAALPGWRDDSVSAALPALKRSCGRLAGRFLPATTRRCAAFSRRSSDPLPFPTAASTKASSPVITKPN